MSAISHSRFALAFICGTCVSVFAVTPLAHAQPARYRAVELEYPDPDYRGIYATGMNDNGTIVGFINGIGQGSQGFVHDADGYRLLTTPGGTPFFPQDVNNLEDIAGYASVEFFTPLRAMVLSGVQYYNLGGLDESHSYAHAISDARHVVGRAHDREGEAGFISTYGALAYDGVNLDFWGFLGLGDDSTATDVNNTGIAVGSSSLGPYYQFPRRAFVHVNGFMIGLGGLGGDADFAEAINDSDVAVGSSALPNNFSIAVKWENGFLVNAIGTLGGRISSATDINDSGVVVGSSEVVINELGEAFVSQNNIMFNVNDLLEPDADVTIGYAAAVNNAGEIAARVYVGESPDIQTKLYRLEPLPLGDGLVLDRLEYGKLGSNLLWVTNATEGEDVYLAYGLERGIGRVPGCPQLTVEIRPVLGVLKGLARNGGEAFFPLSATEAVADRSIIFQAFEPSSCRQSTPGYVWFDG